MGKKENESIYIIPPDRNVPIKTPEPVDVVNVKPTKTYTQAEVRAIIAQLQKGEADERNEETE